MLEKTRKSVMNMKLYVVTFNLKDKNKTYPDLSAGIKAYPGWCKAWESQWFIVANDTAEEICKALQKKLAMGDWLFVSEVTGDHMALLSPNVAAWLKETHQKIAKQPEPRE